MSEHINTNANNTNMEEDNIMENNANTQPEVVTCAHCGCIIEDASEGRTTHDGIVCNDCADRFYTECADCGEWFLTESMTETDDGLVCESCLEDDYTTCDFCHDYHRAEDMVPVNENFRYAETLYACPSCVDYDDEIFHCTECGEYVTRPYLYGTNDWHTVCDDCTDDWFHCENCGELTHTDDGQYDEDSDNWYCDDCFAECVRGRLHDWDYKPREIVFGTKTGDTPSKHYAYHGTALTFGVELEMDDGDNRADCIRDLNCLPGSDMFYLKHDGSLHRGIEVVTHPCDLTYHMEEFPWDDIIRVGREYDFTSHTAGTCGLHVHVGRKQIVDMSGDDAAHKVVVGRILFLLAKFADNFVTFSRRTRGQLDEWAEMPTLPRRFTAQAMQDEESAEFLLGDWHDSICDGMCDSHSSERYRALNVTNSGTIEFRFARGSLKRNTILATIQMYSNLVLLAMHTKSTKLPDVTWTDIITYNKYAELNTYLDERFPDGANTRGITLPDAPSGDADILNTLAGLPRDRIDTRTSSDDGSVEGFHPGMRVHISNTMDHGTVIAVNHNGVGVAFDNSRTSWFAEGHSLGGFLPNDALNGWWLAGNYLVPDDTNLPKGQTVIARRHGDTYTDADRVNGLVGMVMEESTCPFVVYPALHTGHNNAGLAPAGYEDSGWYTNSSDLFPYVTGSDWI